MPEPTAPAPKAYDIHVTPDLGIEVAADGKPLDLTAGAPLRVGPGTLVTVTAPAGWRLECSYQLAFDDEGLPFSIAERRTADDAVVLELSASSTAGGSTALSCTVAGPAGAAPAEVRLPSLAMAAVQNVVAVYDEGAAPGTPTFSYTGDVKIDTDGVPRIELSRDSYVRVRLENAPFYDIPFKWNDLALGTYPGWLHPCSLEDNTATFYDDFCIEGEYHFVLVYTKDGVVHTSPDPTIVNKEVDPTTP